MPPVDYVSIVKSVYKDRRAMMLGALCCLIGTGASAFKTQSPILWAIAAGFVLVAIYRYIDMTPVRPREHRRRPMSRPPRNGKSAPPTAR